jgi:pimeloyl-ACP methyl ester carboxylesterase
MSEQMQQAMPNATLSILPKVRHLAPIEAPAIVADEILALMKRIAAPT